MTETQLAALLDYIDARIDEKLVKSGYAHVKREMQDRCANRRIAAWSELRFALGLPAKKSSPISSTER